MLRTLVTAIAIVASPSLKADLVNHATSQRYAQELMANSEIRGSIIKSHSLVYKAEPKNQDYWKIPDETWADKGGDCEDLSHWLKRELQKKEFDAYVQFGKANKSDSEFHAWVELEYEGASYVIDPTEHIAIKRSKIPSECYVPWNELENSMPKSQRFKLERDLEVKNAYFNWRESQNFEGDSLPESSIKFN